jgi:cell division septation protein DedD
LPPRRSYTPLWWTLAVVALLSLLAGSWHFVRVRLQNRNAPDDGGAALLASPAPTPGAANQPPPASDTILGYTVSVGEHVRLPSAEQRVGALRAAAPEASYFIAPVVREEALYYDVLAGPVADSATAFALLDTLALRSRDVRGAGEVRLAPYAFLLGDYATEDSATARVAGLRRLEIPSYTVPLSGPPPRFRVYAGGYTGPVDAEVMKQILQSVGEPDLLVPRVGKR